MFSSSEGHPSESEPECSLSKVRLRVSLPDFDLDIKSSNKEFVWLIPCFTDDNNETSSPVSVPECGGLSDSFGAPCGVGSWGVSQDMLQKITN